METVKINNNISLHYIEMKKLKTTVAGMYIRRRLCREDASKNALIPYVLKSGCMRYPKIQDINAQLDELYGAKMSTGVIKNGDNQVIFFDCETISDKYAPNGEKLISGLLDMLFCVAFEPLCENDSFKNDIVEREKNTVKEKIQALIDDKRSYAQLRCTQEVCEGDAFAISKFGEIEDLEKISATELYEHYKKMITSSQIDIFISGEANIDELSMQVKKYTDSMEFSECERTESAKIKPCDEVKKVTEKMDVTQGKLSIGFTTELTADDDRYPALVVANSIFGAGTHSKLFMNVREKLSLAYYASSMLNKHKGIMSINAGIEFKNFQKAYDEVILQLNELKNGNITDDELNFSITTITNTLKSHYDDQRYMQLYALDGLYLGIDTDLENYIDRIMKVTKEDVIEVSKYIKENTVYFLTGTNGGEE